MTEHTPGIPLGSWLADLPDERLIRLLELRPDLAQPPPGSIAALAARAQARQSLKAATDELDFLRLAVIDALLVLQARHRAGARRQAAHADRRTRTRSRRRSMRSTTSRHGRWSGVTSSCEWPRTPAAACPGIPGR